MFSERKRNVRGWLLTLFFTLMFSAAALAAVPGQVRGLKVKKASEEKIQLSWYTASDAEKYVVYGARSGGELKRITVVKKKSAWISKVGGQALVCGGQYDFYVKAWNAEGFGEPSQVLTTTVKVDKPGKITSLSTYPGSKSMTLRWSAASKATSYRVYYKKSSTSKWTKAGEVTGTSTTIKGLRNKINYDFAVRPVRTVGTDSQTGSFRVVKRVIPSDDGFGHIHSVLYAAKTTKTTSLQGLNGQKDRTVSAGTSLTISRTAPGGYYTALYAGKYWLVSSSAVTKTAMVTKSGAYTSRQARNYVNNQRWTSKNNYLIWISVYAQRLFVFKKSGGSWVLLRNCKCATGKFDTQSSYGKTSVMGHSEVWYFEGEIGGYWASRIAGGAIHSGPGLGAPASHGCVRVSAENAKWIYSSIPVGTAVYIY